MKREQNGVALGDPSGVYENRIRHDASAASGKLQEERQAGGQGGGPLAEECAGSLI
jgi:hypothetical protein